MAWLASRRRFSVLKRGELILEASHRLAVHREAVERLARARGVVHLSGPTTRAGAQLFISPRTVQYHLRKGFQK